MEGSKEDVNREKFGLVISSYEDLPPQSVSGGDCDCDCDGKDKDDYVFVNHGNGELNVSESNVDSHEKVERGDAEVNGGDQLEIHNEDSAKLDKEIKIDNGETKNESVFDVEMVSEDKIEGGELVKENGHGKVSDHLGTQNGEIESQSEAIVGDGQLAVANGGSNNLEGEVDVEVRDLEDVKGSDTMPTLDEVKYGESGIENADNKASPSLDDDDKARTPPGLESSSETEPPHEIEAPNGIAFVEADPRTTDVEFEEHENHAKEPERPEDEVSKHEVHEDNVRPRVVEVLVEELEPVDSGEKESEPLEADVRHQSLDDVTNSQQLDGEAKELPLGKVITEDQSLDCQQHDLHLIDGENKELDPIESPPKVEEQCELDPSGVEGNQELNSVDSEGYGCEMKHIDKGEIKDQNATNLTMKSEEGRELQTVHMQSEGANIQSDIESTFSGVERPVTEITGHSDESKTELIAKVEESNQTSMVDMQSDISDKPEVGHQPERVHGEGKSELIIEVGGSQQSSVGEDCLLDRGAEETESIGVNDKEIASESLGLDGNDLEAGHVGVCVLENKVIETFVDDSQTVHVSGETCDGVENSDAIEEQGVTDNASCVTDNCLSCSTDDTSALSKVENGNGILPYPVHDSNLETKAVNSEINVAKKSDYISDDTLRTNISFGSFECIAPFSLDDVNTRPEVLNRSVDFISTKSNVATGNSELKVEACNGDALLNSETNGVHFNGLNPGKTCAEVVSVERIITDEVPASTFKGSGADVSNDQNVSTEVVRKPFYYLIRIPRYDDDKLREQIRPSEMQVEEMTRSRDAVRVEYQQKKAACWELKSSLEAAKSEERAARELLMAKKREINSAQSLINLARNARTVDDVDNQILSMEHKIQHETLSLNEEKQLIREMKQLKNLREQLSANTRRQQELQQALAQKEQVEEDLKVLRKEMDAFRDNHSKAEDSFKAARKKYGDESTLLNELNVKFTNADIIRQEAYSHLQTLRKQWSEKNKHFRDYKDDAKAADGYAMAGEKDNLERHCVNQVEKIMELWNKNDEFRKEYIRCNTRSTLRRFRTLDGRSLGQDEEPPSLPIFSHNRVNASVQINTLAKVTTMDKNMPIEAKKMAEDKSSKEVVEQKNKITAIAKKMGENSSNSSLAEVSGRIEIEEEKEERKPTKEEEESARKAEQLRREEAARLREQLKLEEKTKAQEALERKKKIGGESSS